MKEGSLPLTRARSGRQRGGLQPGQAVEVSRGALTGLSGVLVRCTPGSRWIVRLDGLPGGIVLAIDAAALIERPLGAAAAIGQESQTRHRRRGQRRLVRSRK
jgi:hypothetical protein